MEVYNNRYSIHRIIGTDIDGKTFEAYDEYKKQKCKLRLFNKQEQFDPRGVFLDDFILCTRAVHENLLRSYRFDIVDFNNSDVRDREYFFTSEYSDERTKISYTKLSYKDRLYVLECVFRAISYLHFLGIVYGKLSFSNIFIHREKNRKISVKLNDLATVISSRKNNFNSFSGSKFIVSRREADQLTKKADIYSLGVLTYFLVTCKDYKSENMDFDSLQHMDEKLADIIVSSTHVDPDKRPKDVLGLWKDLSSVLGINYDFRDKKYYENTDFSTSFIAHNDKRDEVLENIYSYFDGNPRQGISFIRSRSGIGNSKFLNEIKHRTRLNGFNSIMTEVCDDEEKNSDYPTFSCLIRQILEKNTIRHRVIELLGPDLVHLVPEYADKWRISPSVVDDPEVMHNRIIARYLGLLDEVQTNFPFIMIIDNADKLGDKELDILSAIIKNEGFKGLYLVLSINDMPEKFQDLGISDKYKVVTLNPLDYHDTVNYLKSLLNIGNVAKLIAREITGVCHGNPRDIEKNVKHLYELGRIAVSDKREWEIIDLDFSITEEEAKKMGYGDIGKRLNSFSPDAIEILKKLAVYSQRVNVFFALSYSKLSGTAFNKAMGELLDSGIILRSKSDWGNYYEFSDYRLIDLIYQKISDEDRVRMHSDAATSYAEEAKNGEFMFDSYIYHLTHSKQEAIAIEALASKADSYREEGFLTQALEYYEYALSIIDAKDNGRQEFEFLYKIAETQFSLGDIVSAEENYKKLLMHKSDRFYSDLEANALFRLIYIYILSNRLELADECYDKLFAHSEICKDQILNMKVMLLQIHLIEAHQRDEDDITPLVKKLKETAEENSNSLFIGLSYVELSKLYIKKMKVDEAIENLEKAYGLIEKNSSNYVHLVEINRLLGIINMNYLSDLNKAKYYFDIAYDLAKKTNEFWYFSMLMVDIGHLRYLEDDFENAKTICLEAEHYALKSSNTEAIMLASIEIVRISLELEDYETCTVQLDKYEDLFEKCKLRDNKEYFYYFLLMKAEVYMVFRVMPFVKTLLNQIENNGLKYMDSTEVYKFKLLCAKYYYISDILFGDQFEIESLKELILIAKTDEEISLFKEFLLDTAISAYTDEKFETFNQCYQLLTTLRDGFEKMQTAVKYEFVNSLKSRDIELIRPYAEQVAEDFLPYSWKIYCILADLKYISGSKVEALANYIEAAGQFYDRVSKIPISYREKRVGMDFSVKKIEMRVNVLKEELYGLGKFDGNNGIFSRKLQQQIVKDKTFIEYSKELYNRKHAISIPTWQSLISRLDDDSSKNVEKLLKFLTQFTLAKYGAIFLVDDQGEIVEKFSTDKYYKAAGVIDYISKLKTNGIDYDYIEKTRAGFSNSAFYSEKSILVFAIYLREEDTKYYFRRTGDSYGELKRLLAYVYLESKEIINNLNIKKYKSILSYEGLTSLIINDYNTTKNATVDNLTGTYIRSYVQDRVSKLLERNNPLSWTFSVLMVDIDHFKDVNDNYGHRRGDEVLSRLGEILKKSVRKTDIVGRYGGEEFVVILINASKESSVRIGEKIRMSVEKAKLLGEGRPLTISIGTASYPIDGKQFETLVENADKALYHSKNNGRNLVTTYEKYMDLSAVKRDMLAGIMTPNASENSRRMKAVLDIISVISLDLDVDEKMKSVLGHALDIVHGSEIGVVSNDGRMFFRRNNDETIYYESMLINMDLNYFLSYNRGGTFVRWKDSDDKDIAHNSYDKKTIAIANLLKEGRELGKVFAWSTIKDKEYSYSDYSFLTGISPLIATILDSDKKVGNNVC